MKKYSRLLALLVILGLFVMGQLGCTESTESEGSGTGSIMGTVMDSVTKQPIEGATVSINNLSAQTDSQGQYKIDNTPSGTLTVSKTGYHKGSERIVINAGETVTADFQLIPFITETIINDVFTVPSRKFKSYYMTNLSSKGTLDISLTATQDVQFYLFDEYNYNRWLNGQSNTAYIIIHDTSSFTRTFNIPWSLSRTYYIVVQNTHTLLSSEVTLIVNYTH